MAVLSDSTIVRLISSGELGITPFYEEALQPASYDMALYWKILISPTRLEKGRAVDLRRQENKSYAIEPGRFVGILTEEVLNMPLGIAGRFGLRSEFTRHGLVAFGGIQIDPGFKGRLAISLFNAGPEPIKMELGRKMFTVEFQTLDAPARIAYAGDYQNQDDFPPDQEEFILNAHTVSLAEIAQLPTEIGHIRRQQLLHESVGHGAPRVQSLRDLIAAQGIKPLKDASELTGNWPEDEDFDEFLAAISELREPST